jgi:hypothetical protein
MPVTWQSEVHSDIDGYAAMVAWQTYAAEAGALK